MKWNEMKWNAVQKARVECNVEDRRRLEEKLGDHIAVKNKAHHKNKKKTGTT